MDYKEAVGTMYDAWQLGAVPASMLAHTVASVWHPRPEFSKQFNLYARARYVVVHDRVLTGRIEE